jgi:hypothetical protein
MHRADTPEILDSSDCPPTEAIIALQDLCRMNRWFGGVATARKLIERVAARTGRKQFSMLEVAAGFGEVPRAAARQLEHRGIKLEITDLDALSSHLKRGHRAVVADALSLPFRNDSFDLVSCNLFAHHLEPDGIARFGAEATRVSRCALLINDLVRDPLHLALIYAGWPLMRSHISRVDGVASVKRAYVPEEMRRMLSNGSQRAGKIEISRHYLFRMGIIVWKS